MLIITYNLGLCNFLVQQLIFLKIYTKKNKIIDIIHNHPLSKVRYNLHSIKNF